MVREKTTSSCVLRRRDNITANEKAASSSESEDEEYHPSLEKKKPLAIHDSARVTRRTTRSSQNTETDENGQSKDQDIEEDKAEGTTEEDSSATSEEDTPNHVEDEDGNAESNNSHGSEGEGLFNNIRRSSRRKSLIYGTYQESWMLGGGPVALGYPRRSESLEDHDRDRRRSSRLVPKPNYVNSREAGETENDGDGHDSEDMYTRVKKRRTSFNGTAPEVTPDNNGHRRSRGRGKGQQDEEPVSRRLRDRTTLSINSNKSYGRGPAKSSRIEMILRKKILRKRRRQSSSASSSSSSDSDGEAKSPSKKRPRKRFHPGGGQSFQMGSKKERMMLMEAQPIEVDPKINFQSVGGLGQFIGKLKEIVLFPLIYREFYAETKMRPPRGILLHGPPGTGKTLLARALANECSNINGKKVSFFLRKGADLLNKWIGESERQLRVLFQQAAQNQPSIIFFDEIDGIAPVRSSKSDQVHNSIVSTLLAELDGLQDRGQVIVIGSTNRLDFVDPALRRPGRFDCELPIFLPTRDGRRDILRVLVTEWKDSVSDEMLDELADRSIGFSGADLKLLCWTTCMNSLRRTYPQIYTSTQKYVLNYDSIKRARADWELALKSVSPSTNRSIFSKYSPAQPLPLFVKPLLQDSFEKAAAGLDAIFPWKSHSVISENSAKRLVLCSELDGGVDEYIVPALLHIMETLPVYVLSSESLYMDNFAAESAVTQICMEAAKHSGPCIMYIPNMDRLCNLLSDSAKEILVRMISQSLRKPILILATTHGQLNFQHNEEFWKLFSGSFVDLHVPSVGSRRLFFEPVFQQAIITNVSNEVNDVVEELQLAPPEIPQKKTLSVDELYAIEKRETAVLRELRIFLREILLKLARNKKFTEFTKPVDLKEVPDYLDVIPNPMDLETMMFKLNMGDYMSAGQFIDDVKLIASNCLNYNPHKDESDKRLRMRAYELLDFANTLIEKEMDSDYEEQCNEIIKARDARKTEDRVVRIEEPTSTSNTMIPREITEPSTPENNLTQSQSQEGSSKGSGRRSARRKSSWSRGLVKSSRKPIKKRSDITNSPTLDSEIAAVEVVMLSHHIDEGEEYSSLDHGNELHDMVDVKPFCSSYTNDRNMRLCENQDKYKKVFEGLLVETVKISKQYSVVQLLNLRFNILRLVDKHQFNEEKDDLAREIQILITSTAKNSLSRKIIPSSSSSVRPL